MSGKRKLFFVFTLVLLFGALLISCKGKEEILTTASPQVLQESGEKQKVTYAPSTLENNTVETREPSEGRGWYLENAKAFYEKTVGELLVGEHTVDGQTCRFGEDGALITGWLQIESTRYYFSEGIMAKGTTVVEGKKRFFNADGTLYVGWFDSKDGDRFYYDFESPKPFNEEDLAKIEEEMKKIIKEDLKITRYTLPKKWSLLAIKAIEYGSQLINNYKYSLKKINK